MFPYGGERPYLERDWVGFGDETRREPNRSHVFPYGGERPYLKRDLFGVRRGNVAVVGVFRMRTHPCGCVVGAANAAVPVRVGV